MIIDELMQVQKGSQEAADKIIKHYQYFIYYLMKEYGILDKLDCYDYVTERMLKSFYKFDVKQNKNL